MLDLPSNNENMFRYEWRTVIAL